MADDLDWNAIIASGNDADRRAQQPVDGRSDDHDDAPARAAATGRPLSRREARAQEARAQESASVPDAGSPAPTAAGPASTPADGSGVRDTHAPHSDVRALLGDDHADGAADHSDGADSDAAAGSWAAGPASSGPRDAGRGAGDGGGAAGGGGGGGHDGDGRPSRPPREPHRRSRGALVAGIVIVAVVIAAGIGAYAFAAPKVQQVIAAVSGKQESDDYTGSGSSKVTITIKQGDIGEDVAKTLQRSGVVKTSSAFYKLLLTSKDVQFQPGSYALKKHMSSKAALAALQDADNRVTASIVIPEGTALADIEAGMVSKAGLSEEQVSSAAKDVSAYGLPSGVTSLEGWLFPATYPINPGWTAQQYFQSMVDTMKQHLKDAGVAEADQEHVIVFASLVQKEAGLAADFPKVARVFQNRLDQGMLLQSDATVAYGTGNTHRVTTTDAERADASNKYNTYEHQGLPPGPISNPGDVAIKAVTQPATGNWLYFVTVNLETGETVFSDTLPQHEAAVKQFQAWLRANPSYQ